MPKNCSIPGCKSRGSEDKLSFYLIPTHIGIRSKWLKSINRPITISKYTYICSLHFIDNHKSSLNPIPTVFPWKPINHPRPPPRIRNPLPAPVRKKRKIDSALSTALSEAEEQIIIIINRANKYLIQTSKHLI